MSERRENGMCSASRDAFISAMRNVATSVSVVTTHGAAGTHGATVSAFCSVSADPPTVLVCLKAGSRIAKMVEENAAFCVNVLPESAAHIADRFAGKMDEVAPDRFEGAGCGGRLADMAEVTAFECTLVRAMRESSHMIFVGRVAEIVPGAGLPLTYLDGQYHPLTAIGAAK